MATTQRKHRVFLGVPVGAGGYLSLGTHKAIAGLASSPHDVDVCEEGSSALTYNFNKLWCEALNRKMKHGIPYDTFVMIHTDIAPSSQGWLDQMLDIFDRENADVLSAIVPIKDEKGLTSTAFDTARWTPRRLTMTEAMRLPKTFGNDVAQSHFGSPLLLNTGLMIVRMTAPWALNVSFNIDNQIVQWSDGDYVPLFEPEDWKFSRWCNQNGLRLFATREVLLGHIGATVFPNDGPWGSMQVDSINLTNTALAQAGLIPKG